MKSKSLFPSWPLQVNFTLSLPQPIPLPLLFLIFLFTYMLLFDLQKFFSFVSSCSGTQQSSSFFTSVQFYPHPDMSQISTYSGTTFQLTRLIISTQFNIFPSLSCFSVWPLGFPCFPLIELWVEIKCSQHCCTHVDWITIAIHDLNILILFK